MSRDLVVYHNDINKVSFAGFKEKELDLFFGICFKLKETGNDEIELSFSELKKITGLVDNPKRFKIYIDGMNRKLASLTHQVEIAPNVFEMFVLFTNFTSDYNNNTLTIKVNTKFEYILNHLIGNYTKFDLIEFVGLTSTYSKNIFKLLKQWESIKVKEFKIEEFRQLLGIPVKYRMSELDKFVLTPIMTELPHYFSNLRFEKIKTGRKVTSLKFTWSNISNKKNYQKEQLIEEILISPALSNSIEKAKQNRFVKPYLSDEYIKKLSELYSEEELIHGLKFAYKKIEKEFKTLRYLIKTIETSLEKKETIIKISTNEYIQTKLDELHPSASEEKKNLEQNSLKQERVIKKVTQKQFNILYQGFLIQNDKKDNPYIKQAFSFNYEIIDDTLYQEEKSIPLKNDFTGSKKIYTIDDIDENLLLGKNGKKLVGVALNMKVKKLLREMSN